MNKTRILLSALALVLGLLAFGPASVSAQDPQPPWQGTLTVATQRQVLGSRMALESVTGEAPLPPNGVGETIGIYGHNAEWVNISPHGHMIRKSTVTNIVANPGFTQGWDSRGEANPLWKGTTSRSCEVYLLDSVNGQLRGSGVFTQANSEVGVYAVLGDLIQVSPWLHFLNGDCATGAFPKPVEPVITGGGYINGTQPYVIPMTDSMLSGCDEPHEISGEHVQPDGTILVVCKQAEAHMPGGGEVALWSLGALVGFVSPVPGDGAAVVTAWIARAGKAGVVAIGVASTAVAVQQAAPALTTFDLPPFHPAGPMVSQPVAPWVAFSDLTAVQAALTSVPMLGDEVTFEGDFNELELAVFDTAGNFITRGFNEATVMASAPAAGSVCILAGDQCEIVIPIPSDGELAHALARHGAKALVVFEALRTHPEEVYCGSVSGRCLITGRIAGVGVGVVLYINNGTSMVPVLGRVVTAIGGSRVKVHQVRISSCLEWRVYPPPLFQEPIYLPIPEGSGLCLERGNIQN